jgi:NADPH-ferrihemoprotein reductase
MAATADPMLLLSVALAIIAGLLVFVFFSSSSRGKSSEKQSQKAVDLRADATAVAAAVDKPDVPAIRILYGTQTGTAERFSKQLCTSLRSRYNESVLVEVIDIENYVAPVRLAKEKLVLFLVATYGDGEPTDNAAEFMTWLLKSRDEIDSESPTLPLEVGDA